MSSIVEPQCMSCTRWRSPFETGLDQQTCEAFPEGIPNQIWKGLVDHRQPYRGDHGLRWSDNGEGFPEHTLVRGRA